MANKRIKDLTPVTAPTTGDMLAIDGSTTRGITVDNFVLYVGAAALKDQHITSSGPATVNTDAGIVRVDQAAGAPIPLTLPLAANKTCDVLISDWKRDAGTNNITINTTAPDTFPGGLTSLKIVSNGGSVFLRRIPGVGYAT